MAGTDRRVAVAAWPPLVPSETQGLGRPVALGLLLGLCSLPFVAWWLLQPPGGWQEIVTAAVHRGETPLDPGDAVLLALAPILCASLAGSVIGGLVVRRDPVSAALLAVATSWAVGSVVLGVAADQLEIVLEGDFWLAGTMKAPGPSLRPPTAFGVVGDFALSYLFADGISIAFAFPVIFALLLIATRLRKGGRWIIGALAVIGAFAAAHWWTIVSGPVPFACLAVGVMVWTATLRDRGAVTHEAAQPLGDPPWIVPIRIPRPEPMWTVAGASWSTAQLSASEEIVASLTASEPFLGDDWPDEDPTLEPLPRRAMEPTSGATWWEVESGTVQGCTPGTRVWLDTDGTILLIGRLGQGVVKALASSHVTREEADGGRTLILRDAARGVEIRMHAVDP
ncbi:MAG: hypothetical protein MUE82_12080 [Chloroflexi bacterium]|nr:hypothetical protein [Chloroflexota bacterium]